MQLLERELAWLAEEIRRLQQVVDVEMVRALPEFLRLERLFVSAEICASFCVRALIRLGRLASAPPPPALAALECGAD